MTTMEATELLARAFHLRASHVERAPRGHTNDTFFVTADPGRFVLRASWPGKPVGRAAREEVALAKLHDAGVMAPVCVRRAQVEDRTLHLFERVEGAALPEWTGPHERHLVKDALRLLHAVHAALAPIPSIGVATQWLRDRLARVRALPTAGLPADVSTVLVRIERMLDEADFAYEGPGQVLHGDFHLGNLLRTSRGLAVLDLDDVGHGSSRLEQALATCALLRVNEDDVLKFHDEVEAADLFAASQVLVHLEAVQRGRWSLGPGIGFQAAWLTLAR